MKAIGLNPKPKYEKSIFEIGKRSDALHGQVIIEYERPKAFRSGKWVEHAFEQLVDYIKGEAETHNETLFLFSPKYIGVGFDGEKIFFVQYKGDKNKPKTTFENKDFARIGPFTFDIESAKTLLIYCRALSKQLLTPQNLAESFGPSSKIAPMVVSALVEVLQSWSDTKIKVFYAEWKRLFGIVYGEKFSKRTDDELNELKKLYDITQKVDFQELLFCVHTYFALLMKLIAVELLELKESTLISSFSQKLVNLSKTEFEQKFIEIENGGIYAKRGISNFLEGDFFSWYLNAIDVPRLNDSLREIARALSEFEPATSIINPDATKDLLKKLYQFLVPKIVRHKLGEYYTPDWLAEFTMNEAGYDGNTRKRFLDPACGSGTFLVLAIYRAKEYAFINKDLKLETVKRILKNIWGFDLNPLAIIAARTNYLFALGDLIEELHQVEIPVYLADSVLWPEKTRGQMEIAAASGEYIIMNTSIGVFHVPHIWLKDAGILMQKATPLIEHFIKNNFDCETALGHLKKEGCVFSSHEDTVKNFYNELLELEKQGKNGIWARFLKNAFAPMMAGRFEFVIGNPPWIRWGYLSTEYRNATLELWKNYGLFSLKGYEARLGGGEKDFSMLFVYAAVDCFLENNGILGFLITQEVLKSKGSGEGFRRFKLGHDNVSPVYLKAIKAHDFVSVKPFEGVSNKTAALFIKKGEKTQYPVPYNLWTIKKGVSKIPTDSTLQEALSRLNKKTLSAQPIGSDTGSWQTTSVGDKRLSVIEGKNNYQANLGARVEPYGVFWLNIKEVLSDNFLLINNLFDRGKKKIQSVEEIIENYLVYPAITGGDIERWGTSSSIYVIISQDPKTRIGFEEIRMKTEWARTYSYLLKFEKELLERAAYKKYHLAKKSPFYSQFNISEYTFAKYKVVWKRMANDVFAAVISQFKTPFGYKVIVPTDTVSLIAINNKEEAHYLCGLLNSESVREFIKSYSSAGRGFGTPSAIKFVGIPKYDDKNILHDQISKISQKLHELKENNDLTKSQEIEKKLDGMVVKLFGIKIE